MIEGVDYSTARPAAWRLREAGKAFAVRYGGAGSRDKWLTLEEANSLIGAGLAVVANVEGTATGLKGGYGVGQVWARNAHAHFTSCGMPPGRPIYFSVDWDVQSGEWYQVRDALHGAIDVLGLDRVGIYGGRHAIEWAQRDICARWFWQTYAWSGTPTHWVPGVHIQQYRNGVRVADADCDLDRALTVDYGQWGATAMGGRVDSVDNLMYAFLRGDSKTPNGSDVSPVGWRIRDESWQGSVSNSLSTLLSRPPIILTDAQVALITEALRPALAGIVAEVLGRLDIVVRPEG